MKKIDYKHGTDFNGLTFLQDAPSHISNSRTTRQGLFMCKCGNTFIALIRSVITGNTRSCGCFSGLTPRSNRAATHHLSKHPIYRVWKSIKTRCTNPRRIDYKYYGGRGITLCPEFLNNFELFFSYVSKLENFENRVALKLTLDRINNSLGYQPGNLKWVTRREQANNRTYGQNFNRM